MNFLQENCSMFIPSHSSEMLESSCDDEDLDGFFSSDCFAYAKQLLGKTYCYKLDSDDKSRLCIYIGKCWYKSIRPTKLTEEKGRSRYTAHKIIKRLHKIHHQKRSGYQILMLFYHCISIIEEKQLSSFSTNRKTVIFTKECANSSLFGDSFHLNK